MNTQKDLRDQIMSRAAEDEAFRKSLLSDPRGAVKSAFGIDAPDNLNVHVHEETSTDIHLVVPSHDQLSDDELESLTGGWSDFTTNQ